MDLGAFVNIEMLNKVMAENGIEVPRLRGLRLMKEEPPIPEESISYKSKQIGMFDCESFCENGFRYHANSFEISERTRKLKEKYLVKGSDRTYVDIRWKNVHGYKRKMFKHAMKLAEKRVRKNLSTFNKYCGRDDVLYIHARIGGYNWGSYDGPEISRKKWFLEKVDDPFDSTYCDIYAKIQPVGKFLMTEPGLEPILEKEE